ncbi:MAG: holo-ACP synthase [Anaerolineales bacterium]|nr:holo-ACP synthase [Anaerolineales bacterium]
MIANQLACGVDLVEIERVAAAIDRQGERFTQRIFTARELAQVDGNPASLAARFAAKEAVSKALGSGLGKVSPLYIEILRKENGAPELYLHAEARQRAELLGLRSWAISLSHTATHAIAMVVAGG